MGIKKFYHFHFSSSSPGTVVVQERCDSPETPLELLKQPWTPNADDLPEVIQPNGLSTERQWYLHDSIRPFVPEDDRHTVCPLPAVPKSTSRRGTPTREYGEVPQPKRRTCGNCQTEGHDRMLMLFILHIVTAFTSPFHHDYTNLPCFGTSSEVLSRRQTSYHSPCCSSSLC